MPGVHPLSCDPFSVFQTPAPRFSAARAAIVLQEHFAIRGSLKPLVSERDQNFLVSTEESERFVMKITNSAERPDVTDFQTGALLHMQESDPAFPVPRVYPALNGAYCVSVAADDGREHLLRVLSWLDGTPLRFVENGRDVARSLGACLARLDIALQGYRQPCGEYELLWDIRRAGTLTGLLDNIKDSSLRKACALRLGRFTDVLEPSLAGLRSQVIYNDLNHSNVLVDPASPGTVTGVIDFGDMVYSPLVIDVAVAAAYLCNADENPFADVIRLLDAYTEALPLVSAEIELLYDLMLTRHVMTILITNWRAAKYPENRDYILRNEQKARKTLECISHYPADDVTHLFRKACKPSTGRES
jgi:Ser/Thr protein kinase RdoA (MazF antagonist)